VINPTEIIPGVLFYSYVSTLRKEKVGFFEHNTLVLQVSGHFTLETSGQRISMKRGEMLLIRKNQLGEITKTPLPDEDYQTIVICLQEELLRKIALEEQIEIHQKYTGHPNILIPGNEFLQGYFQSIIPYVHNTEEKITTALGMLKVKEGVQLLLHVMPSLREFLFDFSEPFKIDIQAFMNSNFKYNISISQFAKLTGRSLATFKRDFAKAFSAPPERWLHQKRLEMAHYLISQRHQNPTEVYLEVGFENMSHFSTSFKKHFGYNASSV